MLVTDHDDTADLYRFALEQADFSVQRYVTIDESVVASRTSAPLAIVVHCTPRHDPAAVGAVLRACNPRAVLIGLFSIQLPLTLLKRVLDHFDDVIVIPCSPDALVTRVMRLQEKKRKQISA